MAGSRQNCVPDPAASRQRRPARPVAQLVEQRIENPCVGQTTIKQAKTPPSGGVFVSATGSLRSVEEHIHQEQQHRRDTQNPRQEIFTHDRAPFDIVQC
jgi:hypothetical protein